jgi:hypothetical protein
VYLGLLRRAFAYSFDRSFLADAADRRRLAGGTLDASAFGNVASALAVRSRYGGAPREFEAVQLGSSAYYACS